MPVSLSRKTGLIKTIKSDVFIISGASVQDCCPTRLMTGFLLKLFHIVGWTHEYLRARSPDDVIHSMVGGGTQAHLN